MSDIVFAFPKQEKNKGKQEFLLAFVCFMK